MLHKAAMEQGLHAGGTIQRHSLLRAKGRVMRGGKAAPSTHTFTQAGKRSQSWKVSSLPARMSGGQDSPGEKRTHT